MSTIWGDSCGSSGACQGRCLRDAPGWNKPNATDITYTAPEAPNSNVCSSWTTNYTCSFSRENIKSLQATLTSKNCGSKWTAPLWMNTNDNQDEHCHWQKQETSGEIDFFERGCSKSDGTLMSFGANDDQGPDGVDRIRKNMWDLKDKPDVDVGPFTAIINFDPHAGGTGAIDIWKCPQLQENMTKATDIELKGANCKKQETYTQYYKDSKTHEGCNYHLVSDVWHNMDCYKQGNQQDTTQTECAFSVSDLRMDFYNKDELGNWNKSLLSP